MIFIWCSRSEVIFSKSLLAESIVLSSTKLQPWIFFQQKRKDFVEWNIVLVNPACLRIFIGISPLVALLIGMSLITLMTSSTETGLNENLVSVLWFCFIFMLLGCVLYLYEISISSRIHSLGLLPQRFKESTKVSKWEVKTLEISWFSDFVREFSHFQ